MRRAVVLAVIASLALAPKFAEARPLLETETIVAGAIAGAVDVCLVTYDLVLSGRRLRPSSAYASLEMTLMTVQLTLGISLIASLGNLHETTYDPQGNPIPVNVSVDLILPIGALVTVAGVGLAIHGLWAMTHADPGKRNALRLVPGVAVTSQQALLTLSGRF